MRKIALAGVIILTGVIVFFGYSWFWPTNLKNDSQPVGQSQLAKPIGQPTAMAEPEGFYQVNWSCQGSHQYVSFQILTTGEGHLDVVIETIDPGTRPHSVAKILTEQVYVDDSNRNQVESRVFSSTVPNGHGVHIGLSGENGARTSQDRTLTPLSC